ncbi:MAG: quinone oxidoreductase, partial [Notoacmeibacter sp.]|nr:quinone oxidoreductase [Notoacmeibacter sp.]
GMMLKGMTAWYLLRRTHAVKAGDEVLFHAAAGGVGLIAGEWGRHLGARMIGTAGSPDKIALAKAHGYEHVINYRNEDFVAEVARLTEGRKCAVVYDSVGKDTYPGSLDCLRTYGLFVSFGQSSGPIENFNLGLLSQKGSLYATRPTLFTYVAKREDLETATSELFDLVLRGVVTINVNQHYDLRDAAQAHSDLEGRKTTGTTVLIP